MKKILNNLKTLNKTAWIIIASLCVVYSTYAYTAHVNNVKQKEELKSELLEAKKPSQIERLWSSAEEFRRMSETTLKNIKKMERTYELEVLTYRCFSEQVNRLLKNEEVDEKFCKVVTNLEQFRLKK